MGHENLRDGDGGAVLLQGCLLVGTQRVRITHVEPGGDRGGGTMVSGRREDRGLGCGIVDVGLCRLRVWGKSKGTEPRIQSCAVRGKAGSRGLLCVWNMKWS